MRQTSKSQPNQNPKKGRKALKLYDLQAGGSSEGYYEMIDSDWR